MMAGRRARVGALGFVLGRTESRGCMGDPAQGEVKRTLLCPGPEPACEPQLLGLHGAIGGCRMERHGTGPVPRAPGPMVAPLAVSPELRWPEEPHCSGVVCSPL